MEYQSPIDYRTVFNALPGANALVLPDSPVFTIVASSDEFAAFAGALKSDLTGNSLFKFFPDNSDPPNVSDDVRVSLAICISTRKKNELAVQRYDIANSDGTFSKMYWSVIHTPILDSTGEISHIIHTAINLTERILSNIKDEKIRSLEPAHNLFMQSAIAIHILKGPDLIITLANEPTLKIWDTDKSVIGKPFHEVHSSVLQDYIDIINNVRLTGISYRGYEYAITLRRNGRNEVAYFNLVLQPYYDFGQTVPNGVMVIATEVTEMYNSRKEMIEKERSLELAIAIAGLGVFNIDFRSGLVSLSPQIMEWLGVDQKQLPLNELLKKIHPDDLVSVSDMLDILEKEQTGKRHDLVFRAQNPKTAEWQHLRSIGQVQLENGEPVALLGIIQDITSSVQSTQQLEQHAQRLKSFIDSAPFPIGVYIGREMRIEMANKSILDIWGRSSVSIGQCFADVLPELKGQGIYEQLDRVYITGEPFHAHHSRVDLLDEGGGVRQFYFNYSFTPLFKVNGEIYGVISTAADVTDLVMIQKALSESERNFRLMIMQAPVAMCLLREPSHIVEMANEKMINLWGKSADEVMNKPVFEGLPDAKEQGLEQLLTHVYDTGEMIQSNERPVNLIRFGKLELRYMDFVYQAYRDGNEKVIGVLAIAMDVTEQVVARFKIEEMVTDRTQELEFTNLSLQKSNAELEQFAYIASHDLQEPLRKINMFTGMLQGSLDGTNEKAETLISNIGISVNRMTNLIRDVLSFSQLSRMEDETSERMDLVEILADAIADFDLMMEEKKAVVTQHGLPIVDAIPLQMVQLFHNLISNALKYSRPGVAPEIEISGEKLPIVDALQLGLCEISGTYYKITFRDNGIGFSQEYAAKIFNIFQRLHSRGQYEGTGIGLAICKKIVENHHGTIYATGIEGEGSEFVVVLPERQPT